MHQTDKHTLDRRSFLAALPAIAAATCSCPSVSAQTNRSQTNIIFIFTDDHAPQAMSCYGGYVNTTPHLDRLAREGMLFNNAFVTNSICAPSRAALLTGKYSHLNGQLTNTNVFDSSQTTFPRILQSAGYQTAIIGKWHLRSDPAGFDHWDVLPGQGRYFDPVFKTPEGKGVEKGYVTDVITDKAIHYLNHRDTARPFCLMVHHKAPHRPWEPDAEHAARFENMTIAEPAAFNDNYDSRSAAASMQTMTIEHDLTEKDIGQEIPEGLTGQELKKWKYQHYMRRYLACVASVDDNIGRLLDYLDKSRLAENTLVVYSSDQGFYLGEHGWFDKRFMYEQSLRMPLLARLPGIIPEGSVSDQMVLNVDFAPTFLELAGLQPPAEMQGSSLVPLFRGHSPAGWRTSMYYHYYEFPAVHCVRRHYGIRTEYDKLIHFYNGIGEWEYYDLRIDPMELNNLYHDPARQERIQQLKAELNRLRSELKVPESDPPLPLRPRYIDGDKACPTIPPPKESAE
jgi:arylsulfatase A-like enzyme